MKKIRLSKNVKIACLATYDVLALAAAAVLAVLLTNVGVGERLVGYVAVSAANLAVYAVLFVVSGLYRSILRYEGIYEFLRICASVILVFLLNLLVALLFAAVSVRWAAVNAMLFLLFTLAGRYGYRIFLHYFKKRDYSETDKNALRTMIVGGGDAGGMFIREIRSSGKINLRPVCVIDDDKDKIGRKILNVPVVGDTRSIAENAQKYGVQTIVVAMPAVGRKRVSEILAICQEVKCPIKIIPGIYQLVNGQAMLSEMRDVDVNDLLGRDPVKVNLNEVIGYIEGKTVMVTGGGGSIGSELCRQIASHAPKRLVIVDIYENNAYDIQMELNRKHPNLDLPVLIASIRDEERIDDIFKTYRPEIVFHAAAHKHVPLMETSPCEAIKNNVLGTYNVVRAADKYGVQRFIQISTDKAVNPTNVMGATKRICEMIIQTMGKHSKTEFVAVRFGNVLGSNGSVIPLFKQQIKEGGPVTVTHKDIIRYFMTIPEAVSLVLQAGAYAKGGEIYVLNMGEPVRIYDMAVNLIKLSGLEPDKDIEIKITGLRAGEKLYEERLMSEEGMLTTPNNLISIGKPLEIDEENLWRKIEELGRAARDEADAEEMKRLVTTLVPTYHITNN
ncbi:MAG: nucleoside-diphosphate sugar epimerase [Bacillota bacterium]|nr:MAG: nucleoside-diphosphate sugar epimerase [Bacillota bacterium]